MIVKQNTVRILYRKLLTLYPQTFKEQLAESMEQTFQDLWNEKRQKKTALFGFVLRTFFETAVGIFREHLLLISPGDIMQTIFKTIGSPALISLLLVLPLAILEVVNRRDLNEEFPFMLFLVLWLNLFAISLILLPIWRGMRTGNRDVADSILTQRNALLTKPRSALVVSIILILFPVFLLWLNSLGWLSLDRLFNGPNPVVAHLPGQVISLLLISIPVAAGIIAGRPIVHTLRAGGSPFAHPFNLIIVAVISFFFVAGLVGLIADQWPCFMGVPNCD